MSIRSRPCFGIGFPAHDDLRAAIGASFHHACNAPAARKRSCSERGD
jgi:hypothetical protein